MLAFINYNQSIFIKSKFIAMAHNVTLIPGDGIGPEVISAAQKIVNATNVNINWELCEAGKKSFAQGLTTGVPSETIASIKRNTVALKGPLETPIGHGGKSANVTLRKLFDTFGNIRPVKTMPGIKSPFQNHDIDMIIVRENVEDLYTGIEHMQTPDVAQTLKLISSWGCENISHLAFSIAQSQGRKKVTCATKANIMKLSEGMMKRTFESVAELYPDIESEHIIVDNCAHQMVMNPEQFDVIVMTNMNGDILSDLGSGLVGGLGIAPGANYGENAAIFEAVHGSAPSIAGKNIANPTAVILSSVMMLRHLGELDAADAIENALYVTIDKGKFLTEDISPTPICGTTEQFTNQVMNNLGQTHNKWSKRSHSKLKLQSVPIVESAPSYSTEGVDIFFHTSTPPQTLAKTLSNIAQKCGFLLKMIANRGVQIYPDIGGFTSKSPPHHQCRFIYKNGSPTESEIVKLVAHLGAEYSWTHLERLQNSQNTETYSKAQGES